MRPVYHALVLNLHQPAGNLEHLLDHDEWEARQILCALDRIPRSLWPFEDLARVHLSLSGTLLETLSSPDFQRRVYGIAPCGDILWHLQNDRILRVLGTAYYHPVLPLIPPEDWPEQLARWLGLGRHLFWRTHFPGFWPPEMGFRMEMIPALRQMGYRYVLVDSEHVEPLQQMSWEEIRYQPHLASHNGAEIIVIVRDRDLSNAQQSGMDANWFISEVRERTKFCDFPPLVTTCTDGDNGGWFRNISPQGNFWGAFYQPLLESIRSGQAGLLPTFIEDYLDRFGARGRVSVRAGAWNTGWHHGADFVQWTGSREQKEALQRVAATSRRLHQLRNGHSYDNDPAWEQARWRLLRSQTSCHFFWGTAWLHRCHSDLDETWTWLNRVAPVHS